MKRRNKQTREFAVGQKRGNFVSCLLSLGKFKDVQQPVSLPCLNKPVIHPFPCRLDADFERTGRKVIKAAGYQN